MACTQTLAGIAKDCATSMGGIVEVCIANKADVASFTKTENKITAITMAAGTGSTTAKFKRYTFAPEVASMVSTYTIDKKTGANYVTTDVQLIFNKMETVKRVEITALAQGEFCALVKDCNGNYWFLGEYEAMVASAVDGNSGTARGDRNGYSITLQDIAREMPTEILVGTGGVDLSTIVG